MNITHWLVLIMLTALLSSVLTLLLALVLWRWFLRARLEAKQEELADLFRERVKQGALEAGQALLPAVRKEVEAGFRDALTSGLAGTLLEKAAGTVVRKGTALWAQGLNLVNATPPPEAGKKEPTAE